jgi:hypothetical protein
MTTPQQPDDYRAQATQPPSARGRQDSTQLDLRALELARQVLQAAVRAGNGVATDDDLYRHSYAEQYVQRGRHSALGEHDAGLRAYAEQWRAISGQPNLQKYVQFWADNRQRAQASPRSVAQAVPTSAPPQSPQSHHVDAEAGLEDLSAVARQFYEAAMRARDGVATDRDLVRQTYAELYERHGRHSALGEHDAGLRAYAEQWMAVRDHPDLQRYVQFWADNRQRPQEPPRSVAEALRTYGAPPNASQPQHPQPPNASQRGNMAPTPPKRVQEQSQQKPEGAKRVKR